MLIDIYTVKNLLSYLNIPIKGILHVGAHHCEEKSAYNNVLTIDDDKIIWVDANPKMTQYNLEKGVPHCYTAVLDEVPRKTTFHITNNGESSSLLKFGTHEKHHPHVHVTDIIEVQTETLTQFVERTGLDMSKYNFWNFDIQGSELSVFRGSPELLKYADVIYAEVNTESVYKGCGLLDEMDRFLKEHGLTRVAIKMTEYNWGDAIYARI